MIFDIDRYAIHDGPGIRLLIFMKGCAFDVFGAAIRRAKTFFPNSLISLRNVSVVERVLSYARKKPPK
jgi:hypothetical protein